MRPVHVWLSMAVVIAGCAAEAVEPAPVEPAPIEPALVEPAPIERRLRPREAAPTRSSLAAVGMGLVPHKRPEQWPFHVASARILVHYRAADEHDEAVEALSLVEQAWQVQIDQGGARAPLDDHGVAGPDGRFDVYLWRGVEEPYVYGLAPEAATPYEDWSTAMVLDPWGPYGGPDLPANVFHELRHASQGSDDWWEHPQVFEAEATLWEVAHYGLDRAPIAWDDYQARPEWTLFRDDGYRTWYMYGGALFLLYLSEHVFGGSLSFTNGMWRRSRNPPGAEQDPSLNEPDFVDALETLLAGAGTSLRDQVVRFARARWYTGARANGSLPGGAELPGVAHGKHTRKAGAGKTQLSVSPQMLGTSYVVVERAATDPEALWVSLSGTSAARFAVQAVGGAAPDATLDLSAGPAWLHFGAGRKVTLAVTALPVAGAAFDPDLVASSRMSASLTLRR